MPQSKLPILRPREIIKAFGKLGFHVHRTKGSHIILIKKDDPWHQPVIPLHKKDIPKGTLRSIIRQAGLTKEEFVKLLKEKTRP